MLCRLLAWELEGELFRMFHPIVGEGAGAGARGRIEVGYRKKLASLKVC